MRKDAREAAFKIVFADLFGGDNDSLENEVFRKSELSGEEKEFAKQLVLLVKEHRDELLQLLGDHSPRYAQERIFPVDRAILLIALAEIRYMDDVPAVVSVDEAVGLAKKYSTENSMGFVNGVLSGVINS